MGTHFHRVGDRRSRAETTDSERAHQGKSPKRQACGGRKDSMTNTNEAQRADDPYNLSRFVQAQEENYEQALLELRSGTKRTHWMWYIFPQLDGLAVSATAKRYA